MPNYFASVEKQVPKLFSLLKNQQSLHSWLLLEINIRLLIKQVTWGRMSNQYEKKKMEAVPSLCLLLSNRHMLKIKTVHQIKNRPCWHMDSLPKRPTRFEIHPPWFHTTKHHLHTTSLACLAAASFFEQFFKVSNLGSSIFFKLSQVTYVS